MSKAVYRMAPKLLHEMKKHLIEIREKKGSMLFELHVYFQFVNLFNIVLTN